jgi:hypothetical protein
MKNNKDFSKYEQNLKKVLLTTDLIYNKLTNKNLIKTIEDYSINVKSSFPDEDGFAELVTDFLEKCISLKDIPLTNFFELTKNIYQEGNFIFDTATNQAICEIEGNTWEEIDYVAKFTIIKNIIENT